MKIKITVPETGIQVLTHKLVHAGDIVDLPQYQAEHLIRLAQAVPVDMPSLPTDVGLLPPTTAEL